MNSGIERAALMISEEKHQQDSRKKNKSSKKKSFFSVTFSFILSFYSLNLIYLEIEEHFSRYWNEVKSQLCVKSVVEKLKILNESFGNFSCQRLSFSRSSEL